METLWGIAALVLVALAGFLLKAERARRVERAKYLADLEREAERLYEMAIANLRSKPLGSYGYD